MEISPEKLENIKLSGMIYLRRIVRNIQNKEISFENKNNY